MNKQIPGMFGYFDAGQLGADERADALADERNMQMAQDPFKAMAYATYSGGRQLGQGLARTAGALGGADVRTAQQKRQAAIDAAKAAMQQSGAQPGSKEYYDLLATKLSEAGELDAAERATQAGQALADRDEAAQDRKSQRELRAAQAAKMARVNPKDKLTEQYWTIVEQLSQQPDFQDPALVAKRDALAKFLGLDKNAPRQDTSPWKVVAPTQFSPGYKYNEVTGEIVELEGRIGKGEPGDEDSPFKDLPKEGRKAAERAAGKETAEWVGGARESALRGVNALVSVKQALAANPDLVNKPITSMAPDWARSVFESGRQSINARDTVRDAVQKTLKATLGSQFTQKEADGLFQRAYDEKLDAAQNVIRLDRAIQELQGQIARKDALSFGQRPAADVRPTVPAVGAPTVDNGPPPGAVRRKSK